MIKVGIYKITNLCNEKCYIGQSRNVYKRWSNHKRVAQDEREKGYNYPLYAAFRKYGLHNFKFEIIEECSSEELDNKEIYWIDYFKPEYNQTEGGEGCKKRAIVKLTINDAEEIKKLLSTTDIMIKDIAKQFNVHRDTIRDINVGRTWRDNILYPIRLSKTDATRQVKNICIDCGKEIRKTSIRCSECNNNFRKKEQKISREELKDLIRNFPFTQIGKMFNISDNCVRKWCIKNNLPSTKKEINSYSNEEWENI